MYVERDDGVFVYSKTTIKQMGIKQNIIRGQLWE